MKKGLFLGFVLFMFGSMALPCVAHAWTAKTVKDDPLVRMPGTQPAQGVTLRAPSDCTSCHAGYNQAVEPTYNWKGSMMAQAARDPIFYACMAVAGQDSIWAIGTPNAIDLCERCHYPEGWLGNRSDPPNASAMTGSDFDGVHCHFCHTMWDPFYETTYNGTREGNDWSGYWDEATTLSQTAADSAYAEDMSLANAILLFSGQSFFLNNLPQYGSYHENASGQYFVSPNDARRASFADADPIAPHNVIYSRYHKSKYFCGTCHDVSNPVLANLGLSGLPDQSGGADLITEQYAATNYFHVERTFAEFRLSAYGQQGGAATNTEFQQQGAPDITWAAKCQDCHMRDVTGRGCNKNRAPIRPDESTEHPNSGEPLHDLTGGNAWISYILASLDPSGPVYDAVNVQLLNQGPDILTLDLGQGERPQDNGAELKAGSDRAKQQLLLAATIKNLSHDPNTGTLSFRIQNNTAHKLISGFPEGRRMFINIKAYAASTLIYEVNPYDYTVGTLKGLPNSSSSPPLAGNEAYVDELVYEVHPKSDLTGENETFHFVLATGRYKDNRIPPKGFDIASAAARICVPVWHGTDSPGYFTASEYAGGYDDVSVNVPAATDYVEVTLYYQGTSREYMEFLRDEINGTATTLTSPTPSGEPAAYILQSDPFFSKLKAWGNTIWNLWYHNHGLDGVGPPVAGIVPFAMAQATLGIEPPPPPPCETPDVVQNLTAAGGKRSVDLNWDAVSPLSGGYRIHYDQAGKLQYLAEVDTQTTVYTDTGLLKGTEYCYAVTAWNDCNENGSYDDGIDTESTASDVACATTDVAECGDGILDPGEQCDDGNILPGDCCDDNCHFESAGSQCDDGLFCSELDVCDGSGTCSGSPKDCNDFVSCTIDVCNEDTDACVNTPDNTSCDDLQFCNGIETCDPVGDCTPGTPVDCSDGVDCTDDSCDEDSDTCLNTPDDLNCADDGLFCNGTEYCDPVSDCSSTGDPCPDGTACNESTDICDPEAACGDGILDQGEQCDDGNTLPGDCCDAACQYEPSGSPCPDGAFCNGEETCDGSGTCRSGTPVDCNDGVNCTEDSCDEINDVCVNLPQDQDNDDVCDQDDNCPTTPNGPGLGTCIAGANPGSECTSNSDCGTGGFCSKNQEDPDGDGTGYVCDNCPFRCNIEQLDADGDGTGDVCDPDPGCGGCGNPACELEC